MAEKREAVFRVRHPDHGETVVRAADWQQATVEAATWWEVPWKRVAADCDVIKIGDLPRNVCVDCGKIFHKEGMRCELCTAKARDREANSRAAGRRFWKEMGPRG